MIQLGNKNRPSMVLDPDLLSGASRENSSNFCFSWLSVWGLVLVSYYIYIHIYIYMIPANSVCVFIGI